MWLHNRACARARVEASSISGSRAYVSHPAVRAYYIHTCMRRTRGGNPHDAAFSFRNRRGFAPFEDAGIGRGTRTRARSSEARAAVRHRRDGTFSYTQEHLPPTPPLHDRLAVLRHGVIAVCLCACAAAANESGGRHARWLRCRRRRGRRRRRRGREAATSCRTSPGKASPAR